MREPVARRQISSSLPDERFLSPFRSWAPLSSGRMDRTLPLRVLPAPDDRDLVARCVAGDRSAQRRLFENEKRRVHATLFRVLGPNAHLDDLVQDVFLSVFRSLQSWVDRCAVRAALAHMRGRRGRQHLELVADSVASGDPSAERRALAREATRHLYAALDGLPPKQRMAFALSAIDGRDVSEVAALMGATAVATKARVWRARRYVEKRAKADPVLAEYLVAASDGASASGKKGGEP
jgi:RNA polymerase sigma-70 factor (ECF subfamily)